MGSLNKAAFTHGRTFELYYTDGGHIGPYLSLFAAIRDGLRRVGGRPSCPGAVIRDRAKTFGDKGFNVAVIERNGLSLDVHVFGPYSRPVTPDRSLYDAGLRRKHRHAD